MMDINIKIEKEDSAEPMVVDLEPDSVVNADNSRIDEALPNQEVSLVVARREPEPLPIPGSPVIIVEGRTPRRNQDNQELLAANRLIEFQQRQLVDLQVQVDNSELEQYRLSVIADYELNKIQKKLEGERRMRLEAQSKLTTIILETSGSGQGQAGAVPTRRRDNSSGLGLVPIKVEAAEEDDELVVVDGSSEDELPINSPESCTSPRILYPNPVHRMSAGGPLQGTSQGTQNESHLPESSGLPRRPAVNRIGPPIAIRHVGGRRFNAARTTFRQSQNVGCNRSRSGLRRYAHKTRNSSLPQVASEQTQVAFYRKTRSRSSRSTTGQPPQSPFPCDVCSRPFYKLAFLRQHKRRCHGEVDEKLNGSGCTKCGAILPDMKMLLQHRMDVHGANLESSGRHVATVENRGTSSDLSDEEEEPAPSSSASLRATTGTRPRPARAASQLINYSENSGSYDLADEEDADATTTTDAEVGYRRLSKRTPRPSAKAKPQKPSPPPVKRSRLIKTERKRANNVRVPVPRQRKTKKSDNDSTVTEHAMVGEDPKEPYADYRCTCGREYTRRKSFLIHQKSKNAGKIFGCYLCPKNFDIHQSLKLHVERHHGQEYDPNSKYACGICGQTGLKTLKDLLKHRKRHHQK